MTGNLAPDTWLHLMPPWAISLLGLILAGGLAILLNRSLFRFLTRLAANRDLFWRSLVSRTRGPLRLLLVMWAIRFAQGFLPLTPGQSIALAHALQLAIIVLIAWMARTAVHVWMVVYLRRFKLDTADNLLARKHVTQSQILRRVMDTLIILVALSTALMTFEDVRQYGVSLLASAGVAGIVVGLALQPVLKNLFAGIQLAVTQPIRIDDALLVEGEWGKVEEITATYVVVRIWDWRRLILPLSYFIEKPFQNWTREGAELIGVVMIYLDYRVPVSELRAKAEEIARGTPLWDGNVINVQLTDFKQNTMEIRILVSASDSGRAFELRCHMREHLIGWLSATYPEALPTVRLETGPAAAPGPVGA